VEYYNNPRKNSGGYFFCKLFAEIRESYYNKFKVSRIEYRVSREEGRRQKKIISSQKVGGGLIHQARLIRRTGVLRVHEDRALAQKAISVFFLCHSHENGNPS
jgi:hypothetical protein